MMKLNLLPSYKSIMNLPHDKMDQGENVDPQIVPILPRFYHTFGRLHASFTLRNTKNSWIHLQVVGSNCLSEYDLHKATDGIIVRN